MSQLEDKVTVGVEGAEDFKEMFEKTFQGHIYFTPGQKTSAVVVSISGGNVFINLGGKREGFINLSEFSNEDGSISIKVDDTVEAFFDGTQDGMMRFTTLVNGNSSQAIRYIEEMAQKGQPVEGVVNKAIKGGYEVSVKGIRCFCPQSQMDLRVNTDKSSFEGKTLAFKILEHKEKGKGVIVSRRIILEEEKREKVEALKGVIKEGLDMECPVRSIRNFGIFVDIGGIEGLIPASEIGWGRIDRLEDAFTEGQIVKARVIAVDFDAEKITLSMKALQPDPWSLAAERYPAGSRVQGKVVKLMPFGAFVLIEEGIEGLVHISNLGASRRVKHPSEILTEGQSVDAYVLSVDKDSRKISLTLKSLEKKEIVYPSEGDVIEVKVLKVMPFGILAKINDELTGLIPHSETGLARGEDVKAFFLEGKAVMTVVKEVNTEKERVRLSRKDFLNKNESDEYKKYIDNNKKSTEEGKIGLLGEIIQAKIDEKDSKAD